MEFFISREMVSRDGAAKNALDVAQINGLFERSERILRGHKFMRNVTFVGRRGDSAHHAIPLHFLRAIQFMTARDATGMEMSDPIDIFLDGADQVAFHDL